MLWKLVAILAMIIAVIGFYLMLTPYVFIGGTVLALGIALMCVSMASPEKW